MIRQSLQIDQTGNNERSSSLSWSDRDWYDQVFRVTFTINGIIFSAILRNIALSELSFEKMS